MLPEICFVLFKLIKMKKANKNKIQQIFLSDAENAKIKDNEINRLIERKEVLTNVLEKMIDKINFPQKFEDS